jgi:hypothetical protein
MLHRFRIDAKLHAQVLVGEEQIRGEKKGGYKELCLCGKRNCQLSVTMAAVLSRHRIGFRFRPVLACFGVFPTPVLIRFLQKYGWYLGFDVLRVFQSFRQF